MQIRMSKFMVRRHHRLDRAPNPRDPTPEAAIDIWLLIATVVACVLVVAWRAGVGD